MDDPNDFRSWLRSIEQTVLNKDSSESKLDTRSSINQSNNSYKYELLFL